MPRKTRIKAKGDSGKKEIRSVFLDDEELSQVDRFRYLGEREWSRARYVKRAIENQLRADAQAAAAAA